MRAASTLVTARPDAWLAALSPRDRRVFALAAHKLAGQPATFEEAVRALGEAVEEIIPAGRVFVLSTTPFGPVVGSLLSRVGIVASEVGVSVVRTDRRGAPRFLGELLP